MADAHGPATPRGGLEMYYEIHGDGPPLLLLHGAYMTIDMMGPLLPGLAESRQVIAVELQGHGHTADIDRPITYEQMADDTAALLASPRRRARRRRRLQHGRRRRAAAGDPPPGRGAQAGGRLGVVPPATACPRWRCEMFPSITPEMFAGSPIEEAYLRAPRPNPGDFPTLVEKLTRLDTTPFAWPEDDVRGDRRADADRRRRLRRRPARARRRAVRAARRRRDGRPPGAARVAARGAARGPRTSSRPGPASSTAPSGSLAMIPPFLDAPMPAAG